MRELCPWYALSVKYQHEQTVRQALEFQGLAAMVPTYKVRKRWSDRTREMDIPLFGGYVFCQFSVDNPRDERLRILDIPGVSRIIGFGGRPVPVSEVEIAAIRRIMESKLKVSPWPQLKPGDRVRIERGPLRGIEGHLVRVDGAFHLVIAVELLQRSIAVTVDPATIIPVRAAVVPAQARTGLASGLRLSNARI